jgi:hypothetical protein
LGDIEKERWEEKNDRASEREERVSVCGERERERERKRKRKRENKQ